mmetsp:Transcript_18688/g.57588  ORF Transcript_18688/g.57588 Transcript_18688/m.57588 type:complete len:283 (+) Transcript_18688:159-1007(+)
MHDRHELLDVELDGRRELHRVARPEEELVAVLDVEIRRREDGHVQPRLARVVEDGPLEEVRVAPEEAFDQLVRGRHRADGDARRRHLQRGGVLVLDELHRRVDARLHREDELVVGHDSRVLVDRARHDLQPLLHRRLGVRGQRPLSFDRTDVEGVRRHVGVVRDGPDERDFAQVDDAALALLVVEERRLCKVRVVAEEVAHGRFVQHGVALDPRFGQAALFEEPALVHDDRVPVLLHARVHGPARGLLAFHHRPVDRGLPARDAAVRGARRPHERPVLVGDV